jgi:hypothetical protein
MIICDTLSLLLLCTIPHTHVVTDRYDCIEINHLYSWNVEDGWKLSFKQVLLWEYGRKDKCQWWKLAKPEMEPIRDYRTGEWVIRFRDGETDHEIRAPVRKISHGDTDPELENRAIWPVANRRGIGSRNYEYRKLENHERLP